MRRSSIALAALAFLAAGCGGGTPQRTTPGPSTTLVVPRPPSGAIPRLPALAVPAAPQGRPGQTTAVAGHAAFFNGETPVGNGVYYLKFPDGTLFGYYSYLTDPHYIYHFDLGYEYVFDTVDPNTAYLYDFASGHFWYTGANLFPYVYDFGLVSYLYYYPNANLADHYTTNPRSFYEFDASQIISLPDPNPQYCIQASGTCSTSVTAVPTGLSNFFGTQSNGWYYGVTFTNNTSNTVQVSFSFAGCKNIGPGGGACIGSVIAGIVQRGWLASYYLSPGQHVEYDLQIANSAANTTGSNFGYTKMCWTTNLSGQQRAPMTSCP